MSSTWCNHIVLDPSEIERSFSNEDALSVYPILHEELSEESNVEMHQVKQVLDLIPAREADFVELYFFQKVRQTAIAEMFNISQPTVCYRLQRAAERIRYLLGIPPHDPEVLEADLKGVLSDARDVYIMMGMLRTTCQSDVAHELGVTQGFVRHRYFRAIEKFKRIPAMQKYVILFEYIAANLNILKETHRSKWNDPVLYILS